RICLRERSAEHGKILREHIDQPPFDSSVARDETIAIRLLLGHAEIAAAMRDQLVGLFEAAFVEQELDALPRQHLAFLMLALAPLLASTFFSELIALLQFSDFSFDIHGGKDYSGWVVRSALDHFT